MVMQSDLWMSPHTPAGLLTAYGTTYHVLDVLKVAVTSIFVNKIVTFTRARATPSVDSYEILRRFNLSNKKTLGNMRGMIPLPPLANVQCPTSSHQRHHDLPHASRVFIWR